MRNTMEIEQVKSLLQEALRLLDEQPAASSAECGGRSG